MNFFDFLFDTSLWPARWSCGTWSAALGWVHIISDIAIFLAYLSIPAVLTYFCIKRRDIPFNHLLILFSMFIVFCGSGHLVEATIFWFPVYRFDGAVKLATAIISWTTVLALLPVIPKVLDLPKLEKLNHMLNQDIIDAHEKLSHTVDQLQIANKEMENFLYVVSHDLRAPLINIKGFSGELEHAFNEISPLLDQLPADANTKSEYKEEVPQALKFISGSVQKIDYLIEALLRLSRVGRTDLHLEELDTKAIVDEQILALSHQLKLGNFEVVIKDLPNVVADKTALQQIFGNLIDNACKYRDPARAGKIEITGERFANFTRFTVKDNGLGIKEKDFDKVFEIFKRVDPSATQGEGMGLAFLQKMIKRHQGELDFRSQFGEGSEFFFTISHDLKKHDDTIAAEIISTINVAGNAHA